MAPQKKANSQAAASVAAFKGKKTINGGTNPTDLYPSNLDVVL